MATDFGGCQVALLDSCSLLNIYASSQAAKILRALGVQCAVVEVVARESTYVLRGGEGEGSVEREPVDLQPLVAAGLLEVWSPQSEAEYVS